MNKIIGFEKGGKQCHSSIPAETHTHTHTKRKQKEVRKSGLSEQMQVLPLLTAVRLIVTLHRDISISVWLPEAPGEDDLFTTK